MKYRDKLIDYFSNIQEGTVVIANDLYEAQFTKMSQDAFFRAMERLADDGEIIRISKGLYIRKEDATKDRTEILLNYYFGEDNAQGMFIGYQLYNKYQLTSVKSDKYELLSNLSRAGVSRIGNITVKRPAVSLTFENARIIEALEIFQNYYDIEELDKMKFARYAKQFARGYEDAAAVTVIRSMNYKKSTIAFMKKILDMYKISNSLSSFLSYASDYKIPTVQKIAR